MEVCRAVLLAGSLTLSLAHTFLAYASPDEEQEWFEVSPRLASVRRGIPQGSAASPLVVEMLLAPLFETLPDCGEAIGYVDNFLAMGKCEGDAVSMTKAFGCALSAHPAGQLKAKPPRVFAVGGPIEFLGHQLQVVEGEVVISPTPANQQEFETAVKEGLAKIKAASSLKKRRKAVSRLRHWVRSWTASFSLCQNIKELRAATLNQIAVTAH
jgi:hypothetical protein